MNRIPHAKEVEIFALAAQGVGSREISRRVGVAHQTVVARTQRRTVDAPTKKAGYHQCDFCGKPVPETREFFRRTRRSKHKFCQWDCYTAFRRWLRRNDKCRFCGCGRYENFHTSFNRGACCSCYGIWRLYGFDVALTETYFLNQQLKRELTNGRKHQKHVGPAKTSD